MRIDHLKKDLAQARQGLRDTRFLMGKIYFAKLVAQLEQEIRRYE